jgi:hypothetical protein
MRWYVELDRWIVQSLSKSRMKPFLVLYVADASNGQTASHQKDQILKYWHMRRTQPLTQSNSARKSEHYIRVPILNGCVFGGALVLIFFPTKKLRASAQLSTEVSTATHVYVTCSQLFKYW